MEVEEEEEGVLQILVFAGDSASISSFISKISAVFMKEAMS